MDKLKKTVLSGRGGAILALLLLLCAFFAALRFGSTPMSWREFFEAAAGGSGILYWIRLPRAAAGVLAGAGLAVSGVLLQTVTGNALASPNIVGVNSGAGLACILLMYFAPGAAAALPVAAFFGALAAALLITSVAGGLGASRSTVILAGIALTTVLNAGISFISLLDADVLTGYNYFAVGGLSGVKLSRLALPSAIIAAALLGGLGLSGKLDTLCLGDSVASSLGVRVGLLRCAAAVCAAASAAAAVSFAGLLGFVGLVAPHIAGRLSTGGTARTLLLSAAVGGTLVTLADLLGRVLFAPSEIPVGVTMALIGSPFFMALLFRGRHKNDRI